MRPAAPPDSPVPLPPPAAPVAGGGGRADRELMRLTGIVLAAGALAAWDAAGARARPTDPAPTRQAWRAGHEHRTDTRTRGGAPARAPWNAPGATYDNSFATRTPGLPVARGTARTDPRHDAVSSADASPADACDGPASASSPTRAGSGGDDDPRHSARTARWEHVEPAPERDGRTVPLGLRCPRAEAP